MERPNRQERSFAFVTRAAEGPTEELYVEGYAARFDSPTVLFTVGDID